MARFVKGDVVIVMTEIHHLGAIAFYTIFYIINNLLRGKSLQESGWDGYLLLA